MLLARLWSILRIKAWWYFRGGARLWAQEPPAPEVEGVITNRPGAVNTCHPLATLAIYDATLRQAYGGERYWAGMALPLDVTE